jgi:hypothetical protein
VIARAASLTTRSGMSLGVVFMHARIVPRYHGRQLPNRSRRTDCGGVWSLRSSGKLRLQAVFEGGEVLEISE